LPFATPGTPGVIVLLAANFGLLLVAGVFNPTYATHRLAMTRDDVLARVVAAWSTGTRSVKPLFIVVGGAVAAVMGVRTALGVGGALCLISALVLPRAHEPVLQKAESLAE
jgi:hypothetical protein